MPPIVPWALPYPDFEAPPTSPLGMWALIGVVVAAAYLTPEPPRPKKLPIHSDNDAGTRVVKVRDVWDVIDDVLTRKVELFLLFSQYVKATWHAVTPHQPRWLNGDQAAADFAGEITEHMRNTLKNEVFDAALQQMNKRLRGTFDVKTRPGSVNFEGLDIGVFPEDQNQRRGTLHHDKFGTSGFSIPS